MLLPNESFDFIPAKNWNDYNFSNTHRLMNLCLKFQKSHRSSSMSKNVMVIFVCDKKSEEG